MRYTLADLEKRFSHKPNARWSSIANELRRLEVANKLREEQEEARIDKAISEEVETTKRALDAANEIISMGFKPSYFDRLMKWVS